MAKELQKFPKLLLYPARYHIFNPRAGKGCRPQTLMNFELDFHSCYGEANNFIVGDGGKSIFFVVPEPSLRLVYQKADKFLIQSR